MRQAAGGVGSLMVNEKGGVIRAHGVVVYLESDDCGKTKFINEGRVEIQGIYVIFAGPGNDTEVNHGRIDGSLIMGDGNGVVDVRGGKIYGTIYGDGGNDTLVTDNADIQLSEHADYGADTVKSFVSYTRQEDS
jgi:hypothetical protein